MLKIQAFADLRPHLGSVIKNITRKAYILMCIKTCEKRQNVGRKMYEINNKVQIWMKNESYDLMSDPMHLTPVDKPSAPHGC